MTEPTNQPAAELLPCPFCGSVPRIDLTTWGFYSVRCIKPECRAAGYHRKDRQVAIAAWNTRCGTFPIEFTACASNDINGPWLPWCGYCKAYKELAHECTRHQLAVPLDAQSFVNEHTLAHQASARAREITRRVFQAHEATMSKIERESQFEPAVKIIAAALTTTPAASGPLDERRCVRCSNSLDRYCALCQNSDTCCCCKLAAAD